MGIDRAEVRRIANLARLELDDASVDAFTDQLQSILDHVARLDELDLDAVPPTSHPLATEPAMREDEPRESLTADEALANAPDRGAGQFRVPRVLAE